MRKCAELGIDAYPGAREDDEAVFMPPPEIAFDETHGVIVRGWSFRRTGGA